MRIKVDYYCDKIPSIYNNRFLALIKSALFKSNFYYQKELYGNDIPKPFTFSVNLWNKNIETEWVLFNKNTCLKERVFYLLDKKLSLYISSSDDIFMYNLIKGLNEINSFDFSNHDSFKINFKDIKLKLKNISPVKEKEIKTETIFKTLAPFYFKDKNGDPILFSDSNFEESMNNTISKQLRFYNIDLHDKIEFENINLKTIPVKHCVSGSLETNKPILYLNSNSGLFKLKGNTKILECIYKNGFGTRTSQGFGMLDII